MTEQMLIYRLEDISMVYFFKELFQDFGHIEIVTQYPKTLLNIPTMSVVHRKLSEEHFELGNRRMGLRTRRWIIDIFAKNETQRDDFAYRILDRTDDGINVYDYNEGFPPDASPTKINHLSVISKTYEPLDIISSSHEKLYYRGQLILITQNDKV